MIDAPPNEVWDLIMDPKRLKDWVTIHRKLRSADSGSPRVGTQMSQTLHLRGTNFKVEWELVECDPERRAVWEGRGPARSRAHTEYRLSERDGRTCFDYHNDFKAPLGALGAAASRALVGGISEREANRSLERLKALLEN
jgi:carbon monoxide dehydrogenase subunit G